MHASATASAGKKSEQQAGLAFWMQRVLEECDRASVDFAFDPVHDLRVALRRCRSMADGLMAIHPDPAWKEMKKAGKRVFSSLGELRDVQVIEEWVGKLGVAEDPVARTLLHYLANREQHLKTEAAQAVHSFDRRQWIRWSQRLPRRAARMKPGSPIFKHLALERWVEAHELHRRALRNRSQVSFHQLRIGLKRFRYIVENFLPQQHHAWRDDLKELQDVLGEVHDLDVLWATALQIRAFPDAEARARWHARVREERDRRIARYHEKMVGKGSLWSVWRTELPQGDEIKSVALQRLMLWASNLDPDFKHSNHVARLALQLYDGLAGSGVPAEPADLRGILRVAALLHDVGRSKHEKGRHKASYRLIRRLASPLGWSRESLRLAGIVARYHRGALPQPRQKALRGLSPGQRQSVLQLAGMLRLADAFDIPRDGRIQRLAVCHENGFVVIGARGYSARDRRAEAIAGARHLLEVVYRRPVIVQPLRPPRKRVASN